MDLSAGTAGGHAFARFLRALSSAALELARDLETMPPKQMQRSISEAGLGPFQQRVAQSPGMDTDEGVAPRQITHHLERGDEPNIRTALTKMRDRGVTELVPGPGPQRWRLTPQYRSGSHEDSTE